MQNKQHAEKLRKPHVQKRIVDLMYTYHEELDKAAPHLEKAEHAKRELLRICSPGRYDAATVYEVKEKEIQVSAYVRHGFKAIRLRTRK